MGWAYISRINLSIMHPRLMSTLILYEPVMMTSGSRNSEPNSALPSTMQRELWDSRVKAESYFRKVLRREIHESSSFTWSLAWEIFLQPYKSSPDIPTTAVTLTTSKHQEAWNYTQCSFKPKEAELDRLLLPDWDKELEVPMMHTRTAVVSRREISLIVARVFSAYLMPKVRCLQRVLRCKKWSSLGGNRYSYMNSKEIRRTNSIMVTNIILERQVRMSRDNMWIIEYLLDF